MIAEQNVASYTRTGLSTTSHEIDHYCLIETGRIVSIGQGSFVTVEVASGETFADIELLYPASMGTEIIGHTVLVFIPRTPVASIDKGIKQDNAVNYSYSYAKALLVDTGLCRLARAGFQGNTFQIAGQNYSLQCDDKSVSFVNPIISVDVSDRGIHLSAGTHHSVDIAPGGTYVVTTYDGTQIVSTVSYASDGSLTYHSELNGVTYTQLPNGALSYIIQDKCTLSVSADGSIVIDSKATISGTASSGTTLTDNTSVVVNSPDTTLTGGNVNIAGAVSPTGSGALCGVPYCCFTGAPHVGPTSTGA